MSLQITVDGNPAWAGLLSPLAARDLATWCRSRPGEDPFEQSVFEHLACGLEQWAQRASKGDLAHVQ